MASTAEFLVSNYPGIFAAWVSTPEMASDLGFPLPGADVA